MLDVCVEIPQQGVIRSLNVHVSAALLIWEYTRQHLSSGPSEADSRRSWGGGRRLQPSFWMRHLTCRRWPLTSDLWPRTSTVRPAGVKGIFGGLNLKRQRPTATMTLQFSRREDRLRIFMLCIRSGQQPSVCCSRVLMRSTNRDGLWLLHLNIPPGML